MALMSSHFQGGNLAQAGRKQGQPRLIRAARSHPELRRLDKLLVNIVNIRRLVD